jgi:hypothetical protein
MALMYLFVLIAVLLVVVSANPWAQKEALDKRKASSSRRAHSVTKNRKSEVQSPALRSEVKLEASTTENWIQYELRDSQTCAGDAHYYYWQATDECAEAEYIAGYTPNYNSFVKVACVDLGTGVINITNTYYSDSGCGSMVSSNTVSVPKACSNQTAGAFLYDVDYGSAADFDEYDMIYGDMVTTSCVAGNMEVWNSVPAPNGQLSMYYEDNLCATNMIAADLFVSDVCSQPDLL